MNTAIQNLAPESQRELCKTFGLKNINQLAEVCFVMLVLHNVNTPETQLHIDFLPREDMGWKVVEGKPIHYLDMRPNFHREKLGGVWREMLALEDQVSFSAREMNKAYDDQGGLAGTNWRFDFPQGPLTIYKPLDPHQFTFYSNPKTQQQSLFVFKPIFR